jgi:hypothetical protein
MTPESPKGAASAALFVFGAVSLQVIRRKYRVYPQQMHTLVHCLWIKSGAEFL